MIDLIVKGEEDLGVQRLCRCCWDWWPLEVRFYEPVTDRRPGRFHRVCRTCKSHWRHNVRCGLLAAIRGRRLVAM